MNHFSPPSALARFLDIRPGEARHVGIMVSLLFFLLAAINVIKVVRDSLFLNRFPIGHLPYVYLLAALLAGVIIAVYTRYTARLPLYRLILGSHAFIISNVIVFWFLIVAFDFAWGLYAFYIWSAIVSVLAVAQFWTFANLVFTSREAKRLFGVFAGGGSLGAMLGASGSGWAANRFMGTDELFGLIGALFTAAFAVVWFSGKELGELQITAVKKIPSPGEMNAGQQTGALGSIRASRYLQLIAGTVLVSAAVSTLIDFQFKAEAKTAYPSQNDLTAFFGSYYAWVAIITFFSQVVLTRKLLTAFGLIPSLFLLPAGLFAGSLGILVWPGLFTATATRFTDAVLRASINQSGVEILYFPLSAAVKKRVKTFLDVVLQRLGDGAAGLIALFYTLFMTQSDLASLAYCSLALIIVWTMFIFILRSGYIEALRSGLEARAVTWEGGDIDYADKQTIEAILQNLQKKDEAALVFGLDLAEKLDPEVVVPRLPLTLLQDPSPVVRTRALKLFATSTEPEKLKAIVRLLEDENREVQAEAINVVCAIRKEDAIPVMRPYLESPDPRVRGSAVECLLHHGDAGIREVAMVTFRQMIASPGMDGAVSRMEAARLMGEVDNPQFSAYLNKLIREDASIPVIRQALAAAGKRKDPALLGEIIARLCCPKTKNWAREALIEYGELAVKNLREALLDSNISRDIRLSIPRTLSKIAFPAALDALVSALNQEDGALRYKVILGLEEMARRSPNLPMDRRVIETAIVAEARRYYRRFLIFFALFGDGNDRSAKDNSLLHQTLVENMEREKERVLRLLSLIYPPGDIGSATAALGSGNRAKQAQAIELLDNLLTGDVKRYVFPLFDDAPAAERFEKFLEVLDLGSFDREAALQELLKQDDVWLKVSAIWEIGLRGLRDLRGELRQYLDSREPVVKETAELVMSRI
jgi:AAA family ATP:ADP antiporter